MGTPPEQTRHETRLRDVIAQDLEHMVQRGDITRWRWLAQCSVKFLAIPRVRAVVYFRIAQALARRRLYPVALFVEGRVLRGSGAEISPLADIGPGLCLMHSSGIVIGHQVRIGPNAQIYQGVTIGDGARPGQPRVGSDVVIGAGAAILGGVTIGDRVIIGANSVVTTDIPDDCIAIGAPARSHPRQDRHEQYVRPSGPA